MKYIVMECHLSYAIVLDEEGHFFKVANRNYQVGQTVTNVIEMQIPPPVSDPCKKKISKWITSFAAVAACLVIAVTSVSQIKQMTYASVYMTINPEVRIDVNRSDIVVNLNGVNSDGEKLIAGYNYKKKKLDLVTEELVDRAIDTGYLHEGGQISLVLNADSDEWVLSHRSALTTNLNKHLQQKLSVTIKVTDKKEQSRQIVIPVIPQEPPRETNRYDNSLYDDELLNTEGDSPYDGEPLNTEGDSPYDGGPLNTEGDSPYDGGPLNTEGDSPYDDGPLNTEGDSPYDDEGQINYEADDN